jgi:cation diffusion facilitator CzcD-associated flavoprotein CzcO
MSKQNGRPKVVIIGGGFGGLYAAKRRTLMWDKSCTCARDRAGMKGGKR